MKVRYIFTAMFILFAMAVSVAAQDTGLYATLDYYDDFSLTIEMPAQADGSVETLSEANGDIYFGMQIPVGATIITSDGSAELTLVPNGSVMKLASGTNFTIENLSPSRNSGSNDFSIAQGRVRTVAARLGGDAQMRLRSNGALAGVRGTDFTFDANNGELFVLEGLVDFGPAGDGFNFAGQIVQLAQNQFANAIDLSVNNFDPQTLSERFGELTDFVESNPEDVPKEIQQEGQESAEEETSEEQGDDQSIAEQPSAESEESEAPDTTPEDSAIMDALGWLGMEIGSITLDGDTYSKAVFQPEFTLGKFHTKMYLPIIYTSNFLDPDDWYRPQGNDEWSFGTDQDADAWAIVSDVMTDLILKFKYIEYGDNRDPFFFQLGNVESMTLGHGILIREYANDADFPSVRRVGLNLGFTTSSMKFQALVNDLADPYLFGTRIQFGSRVGFGISAAADISPASVFEGVDSSELTNAQLATLEVDPMFFNLAVDFDIPIVEKDALSMVLFADAAGLLPYLSSSGLGLSSGFQFDSLVTDNGVKNYGIESGLFGNVSIVDYRVQFQYYNGTFVPGFYNQPYDRIRGDRAADMVAYLQNPESSEYDSFTMGIYGEGGFNLFNDRMLLELGYLWPWTIEADGDVSTDAEDYFTFGFSVDKELLSFLPWEMELFLYYDRVMFRDVFTDSDVKLFDANATVTGEAVVGIAPGINLAFTVSSNVLRDSNGNIVYENGSPVVAPSIGLETRIGN